jgi:phage repressor protein C with HTH and peptisase S24 domain
MQEKKLERFNFFIKKVYESKQAFASEVGISPSSLSQYLSGKISKPSNKMIEVMLGRGLNLQWLNTGEGEMLVGSGSGTVVGGGIRDSVPVEQVERVDISRLLRIPLYNVPAYAMRGTDFDIFDEPVTFVELSVGLNVKQEDLVSFRVSGDSMEDAHIHAGDIVVVNVNKPPTHNVEVCAQKNNTIIVKRYHKPNGVAPVLRSAYENTAPDVMVAIDDSVRILGVVEFVVSYRR